MRRRYLPLFLVAVSGCTLNLAGQYPRLTAATVVGALRIKIQKTNCSSPEALYLDGNQLEFLPETYFFTELDWACSGESFLQQSASLKLCQETCKNNTSCSYVSMLAESCLLYTSSECNSSAAASGLEVLASYRKDAALAGMENFENLAEIDLGDNRLTSIPIGIASLKRLTYLELQKNRITSLPNVMYPRFTSLQYLGLRSNNLTNVSLGFFGDRLTSLVLTRNNIAAFLPNVFEGLGNLGYLNFENNNISQLAVGVFSALTMLTALYFDVNPIVSLPQGVFNGLTHVEDLRMGSTRVASLPEQTFRNMTKLAYLQMMGWTSLSSLPPTLLQGLTSLTELLVSHANLTSLPSSLFRGLSNLKALEFQYNPIHSLPFDIFSGLTKLTRLELDASVLCSQFRRCPGQVVVGSQLKTFIVDATLSPTSSPTSSPTPPTNAPSNPTARPTSPIAFAPERAPNASMTPTVSNLITQIPMHTGASDGLIVGVTVGVFCLLVCLILLWRKRTFRAPVPTHPDVPPGEQTGALLKVTTEQSAVSTSQVSSSPTIWEYDASKQDAYSGLSGPLFYSNTTSPLSSSSLPVMPVFSKGLRIYTALKMLGKGHFGTAYLVSDPQGTLLVVKTVVCSDQNEAMKEAKTLSLKTPISPHLLNILDFFFEERLFCIVLNYCQGGNLQELISQNVELDEIYRILREIATGLDCLHNAELVHRDLKPDNIFVKDTESKTIIIGDMGMARSLNADGYYDSWFGHMLYKAPEIEEGKFSPRSDMWAVGCIGFELLRGETLASMFTKTKCVLGRLTSSEMESLLNTLPEGTKRHVVFQIISGLLVRDPRARLTALQVKEFQGCASSGLGETSTRVNFIGYD